MLKKHQKHYHQVKPGQLPGIEGIAVAKILPKSGTVVISYTDYCATRIETNEIININEFLKKPLPAWV